MVQRRTNTSSTACGTRRLDARPCGVAWCPSYLCCDGCLYHDRMVDPTKGCSKCGSAWAPQDWTIAKRIRQAKEAGVGGRKSPGRVPPPPPQTNAQRLAQAKALLAEAQSSPRP